MSKKGRKAMAVVKFENVSRVYKSGDHELKALDSVNMELEEGKFVVILGPSGAGKSTLLNLLGGLDSPTDGKDICRGRGYIEALERRARRLQSEESRLRVPVL